MIQPKNRLFAKYIRKLLVLTALLTLLIIVYHLLTPVSLHSSLAFYLPLFFFAIMAISHFVSIRIIQKNIKYFVNVYMVSAFARLIIYMVVVFLYVIKKPPDMINFVLIFFVLYIVFTAFEVREMNRSIRKTSSDEKRAVV